MKTITRIAIALVVAVVIFWLIRFGGWMGSLTTQRMPIYFTLNHIGAWVGACIAALMVFFQVDA